MPAPGANTYECAETYDGVPTSVEDHTNKMKHTILWSVDSAYRFESRPYFPTNPNGAFLWPEAEPRETLLLEL